MTDSAISRLRSGLAAALHLVGGTRALVAGISMEPRLMPGDRLLISRLARCRPFAIERGQIVLLKGVPGKRPESVKRVAGLPGERVFLIEGALLIEAELRPEPGEPPHEGIGDIETTEERAGRNWFLGPRDYFVLGDNREFSTDSRQFGPVQREAIIGIAWYRYAPPQRRGWLHRPPFLPWPRRK